MYKKTRALWRYFLREAKLGLLDATDASESNARILVALSRLDIPAGETQRQPVALKVLIGIPLSPYE